MDSSGDAASSVQEGCHSGASVSRSLVEVVLARLTSRTQITHIFKSTILPLPNVKDVDEQAWTDRLLLVASHLDETSFKALEKLTGLPGYAKGLSPYRAFVDFCEANNVSDAASWPLQVWDFIDTT